MSLYHMIFNARRFYMGLVYLPGILLGNRKIIGAKSCSAGSRRWFDIAYKHGSEGGRL